MKTKVALISILFLMPLLADGHSGRLDKNGGHNCSKKSKEKGLCSGYHYHRSGAIAHSHGTVEHSHVVKKTKKKKAVAETPVT